MLTFLLSIMNLELTFALKHALMLLVLQQQPQPHHPHRVKTIPNMLDIVLFGLILNGIATTLSTGLQHSWKTIAKNLANSVEANLDKTRVKLLTPPDSMARCFSRSIYTFFFLLWCNVTFGHQCMLAEINTNWNNLAFKSRSVSETMNSNWNFSQIVSPIRTSLQFCYCVFCQKQCD